MNATAIALRAMALAGTVTLAQNAGEADMSSREIAEFFSDGPVYHDIAHGTRAGKDCGLIAETAVRGQIEMHDCESNANRQMPSSKQPAPPHLEVNW